MNLLVKIQITILIMANSSLVYLYIKGTAQLKPHMLLMIVKKHMKKEVLWLIMVQLKYMTAMFGRMQHYLIGQMLLLHILLHILLQTQCNIYSQLLLVNGMYRLMENM